MKLTAHEKKARRNHCPSCHVDPDVPCVRTGDPAALQGRAHRTRARNVDGPTFADGRCVCVTAIGFVTEKEYERRLRAGARDRLA